MAAQPTPLDTSANSRIVPPDSVITAPGYQRMRRWLLGRGRHSGFYVLPLLIIFLPFFVFFSGGTVCVQVCVSLEHALIEALLYPLFWNAYFAFVLLCLAGPLIRLVARQRQRRRQRRFTLDDHAQPDDPADAAPIRAALATARAKVLDPKAHEPQLRDAVHAYTWLLGAMVFALLFSLGRANASFEEDGYVAGRTAASLLLSVAYAVLGLRTLRLRRHLAAGAREHFATAEADIERHQAALEAIRRGDTITPLAVSFRRFGAPPSGPGAKS